MAKWEEELIDDVNNYTLEYILSGNNYTEISNNVIEQYKHTFTRLMSTIWKDILFFDGFEDNGLRFEAFTLEKDIDFSFKQEGCIENIKKSMYQQYGEVLYIQRILRLYIDGVFILINQIN